MQQEAVEQCPVHSYSPHEPRPLGEWNAFFDQLREEAPVVRNTFAGGYFVLTRYEDILAAYQDPETYSSEAVTVMDPDPAHRWIPHMLGGEEHRQWRRNLGPAFSPRAVSGLDDRVRQRAGELIDSFADRGSCDVMTDFAFRFPTSIFLELMGLPSGELERFMDWEADILHSRGPDPATIARQRTAALTAVGDYVSSVIRERRADPGEDLVSQALQFRFEGRTATDEELRSYCVFMFMAGLDTVAAQLGYILHHLATHPEDRRRIVDEPELLPVAVEEFLRAYSFVIPARKVKRDVEVAGCPIPAGSMVQLPLAMATRDTTAFEDAGQVRIDRTPNNHIAFGAGPHRCLGAHLARHELQIALTEWHRRIPEYRLAEGAVTRETGRSSGPDTVPVVWDRQ